MPATSLELIVRAYKALGVVGTSSATSPTTEERTDGLTALNSMLESWANENLTLISQQEQSFPLVIGTNSYTIGSGGDINVTRPLQILSAYVQDSGGNNYPLTVRTRDQWNMIGNKSSIITSQIPTDMFYDPTMPLGTVYVFPYPLTTYNVFFDSYLQLTTFSSLTVSTAMSPGYERALVYNLAVEISNQFGIPMLGETNVADLASRSLAAIKRTNLGNREVVANYEGAIVSHPYGTYNIYSDR